MSILVLIAAVVSAPQPGREAVVLDAFSADRAFKLTLSLPTKSSWDQDIEGRLKIQNLSRESRYVYDLLWPNIAVFYENVGERGLSGPVLVGSLGDRFHYTSYLRSLGRGESLDEFVGPGSGGWDFDRSANGTYKVVIAFDDTRLWPENLTSQRIGRVAFPLTLKLTSTHLLISPRTPGPKETSKVVPQGWICGTCELGFVSRKDRLKRLLRRQGR